MTLNEPLTPPATLSARATEPRQASIRRPPARSLVLAQSWVPFSVSRREQAVMRQSAVNAAEAFNLLSNELATRRGEIKPPTA